MVIVGSYTTGFWLNDDVRVIASPASLTRSEADPPEIYSIVIEVVQQFVLLHVNEL